MPRHSLVQSGVENLIVEAYHRMICLGDLEQGKSQVVFLAKCGDTIGDGDKPTHAEFCSMDPFHAELSPQLYKQWLRDHIKICRAAKHSVERLGLVYVAVRDGHWRAMNTATLDIEGEFPLEQRAAELLGVPVVAVSGDEWAVGIIDGVARVRTR